MVRTTAGVRTIKSNPIALGLLAALALSLWLTPWQDARAQMQREGGGLSELSPYPLRPPNLESPRATLQSFLINISQAIERLREEEPPHAIRRALRRALLCMDLSQIPLATREAIGTEKALLLKEILDRIELPPFDQIPDLAFVKEEGLTAWTIPNTELTLVRIEEGPHAGLFRFSPRTVALLEDFYELAEFLPYKRGATIGAYEDFLYGPGTLLPLSWVDRLPSWTYQVIAEQTVWQWILLIILLIVVTCAIVAVYRCGHWWDQRFKDSSAWLRFGKLLTAIFVILTVPLASLIVDDAINITGIAFVVFEFAIQAVAYAAVAWLAALLISRIGEGVINAKQLRAASLNSQMIRTITRLIALIVVIYIGVVAAESFGIPVAPLIAGLGVGGLAIALAVRPTLENIVGGFILFADKPVRVGDFCSFGPMMGTVEEIGLRSTRLRALDRTVVTVPNAEFANMQLVNWARCDQMLIETTIGLRYETKPEQLRYVLAKLREMLIAHPMIDKDSMRVRFVGYGESSQDVLIRVYAMTRDWNEFYAIQEDIFLRAGEIVEESGTSFAFPSRTLYMGRDPGIDQEKSDSAMESVKFWRNSGQLPFPRMAPTQRDRLTDTLDYPPRGSPDALRSQGLKADSAEPLSRHGPEDDEAKDDEKKKGS
ncbi:MAG: mechanosensitive ion channel family protein [Pseudomonadota bacterium]